MPLYLTEDQVMLRDTARQLMADEGSIANQLRNVIVSRIVDAMGSAKIPVLDLAGNYEKLSQVARERIAAFDLRIHSRGRSRSSRS